jgi:anti-anti-sigma factor
MVEPPLSRREPVDGIGFWVSLEGHGAAVVRLVGELDLAAVPTLQSALAGVDGDVELDCSEIEFIDAAGLGAILRAQETCTAGGGKLVLVDPGPAVDRLLQLVELDTVLSIRRNGEVS